MADQNYLNYLGEFLERLNKELLNKFPDKNEELERAKNELLEEAKNYEDLTQMDVLTKLMTSYYQKLSSFLPEEELSKILGETISKLFSEI
jgi:hypothetical protein